MIWSVHAIDSMWVEQYVPYVRQWANIADPSNRVKKYTVYRVIFPPFTRKITKPWQSWPSSIYPRGPSQTVKDLRSYVNVRPFIHYSWSFFHCQLYLLLILFIFHLYYWCLDIIPLTNLTYFVFVLCFLCIHAPHMHGGMSATCLHLHVHTYTYTYVFVASRQFGLLIFTYAL